MAVETRIWAVRTYPPGWPANPPIIQWNTNGLMWGMKGITALSPAWSDDGGGGQAPVTALTKRHGYVRGHSMGPEGFTTARKGKKVWFLATNNSLIEMTVEREVVRVTGGEPRRDYTILLFTKDLPDSIRPIRVVAPADLSKKYPFRESAPTSFFKPSNRAMWVQRSRVFQRTLGSPVIRVLRICCRFR
jgi:hypothetical protein